MADYDITQIDVMEHHTGNGTYNSLVQINSTHVLLGFTITGSDGGIKYLSYDGSYNISSGTTFEHATINGIHNSLVKIDDTHFILAYAGSGNDGIIKTFSIDGSYNITQEDALEHDTLNGTHNSLVMIDSTHFILAYAGDGDDGYIKTFSIDGSYNITEIDSLEHDTVNGVNNSLVMIDSTHFVLAYISLTRGSYIKTFSIDGSYNITEIDSLEHDTTDGNDPVSLVKIDDTHVMLGYMGQGYDGYIKTFTIDGSYNITETDSLEHDTTSGWNHSLVQLSSTHYVAAYTGNTTDSSYLKVFSVDGSYNITQVSSMQHYSGEALYSSLIKIDDSHLFLCYAGPGDDGYAKTFSIELPSGGTTFIPKIICS